MSDLPFQSEYAKSGRAGCKACKTNIAQDSLRMAIMVQSPMFDGKVPNWFHFECFWKRARVSAHTDIYGFNSLRWDDQEKVKAKISGAGGSVGGASATNTAGGYADFAVEYAKSNRSKCRGCDNKIEKDEVRISKKDYDSQRAKMYGPQDLWHHIDCFVLKRTENEFTESMDPTQIQGFNYMRKEEKEEMLEKLGKGDKKKRKAETAVTTSSSKKSKTDSKQEEALKIQSQLIWKIRDELQKQVSNEALKALLEYNKQEIPAGEQRLLDAVSDVMSFGALEPCKECKGQLKISGSEQGYSCTGNVTEWTKCLNIVQVPARRAFKVPKEFKNVDVLKNYKYVKRDRIFPPSSEPSASLSNSQASAGPSASKPLGCMNFVIIGKTEKKKPDLIKIITELGGKLVPTVDKSVIACLSTAAEVTKMGKAMKQAQAADVHVVDEGFLDEASKGGIAALIVSHSIASWGSDVSLRIQAAVDAAAPKVFKSLGKSMVTAKDEAYFTSKMPSKLKMTVKGGAAVDSDSGLEANSHVLQDTKGEPYNAVLGMVDIVRGTNSYYKLQIIESDKLNKWTLFRAWGRVGTTIGGNKSESFSLRKEAENAFKALYEEKTGNDWKDRASFVKVKNKFYPLDIDYGGDDEEVGKLDASAGMSSKLPKPVQALIRMIFDVESMKKAMLEYEIDLKKMPLGKLSKKQIENAYKVLSEIQQLIHTGGTPTQILDGSNRFYTLIPHDFGMKKPPLLDTSEIIKSKAEMLDSLLEIEIAYNLIKGDDSKAAKDPLDSHYEKLKTDIKVLKKESEEYTRLVDYVRNTHAATHQQYDLEVNEIFSIDRKGEAKCFAPFKELHNRKLLWHGSRTTNYAGILSQGLRIAPPEAPVTGYMFGKGIYFADMVSKSANYCRTSKSDPVGFLLLCEVALGNEYELLHSEFVTTLPKGKHSTKGCGMTVPDPKGSYVTPDGLEIPMGKGVNATIGQSSLMYNEFIVYDVAQVNIKYMLQVNFKHKW